MKRLAAVAVIVAWLSSGAFAQRGGTHGGLSGSHAGISAPASGFSGHSAQVSRGGFPAPPSGFSRLAPPRYMGPTRLTPRPLSYPVRGASPVTTGPRMPYGSSMHRAPYHSPYGNNHHDGDHHPHNRVVYASGVWPVWGWGYSYGWGYPYLSSFLDDSSNYDSQPASYYAAAQPSDYSNGPYQAQPEDQQGTAPREPYEQQPSTLHRAPYGAEQSLPPASEESVTIVFKDGRPPEQIHNYLLTQITLTVLDQHRHDIPVDQIDLSATARANLQAGVEFSVPGRTH